jgi:hypothetical protein
LKTQIKNTAVESINPLIIENRYKKKKKKKKIDKRYLS